MLVLTAILLLLLGVALGLARRPWWEMGVLILLACAVLHTAEFWIGDWRRQVGFPGDNHLIEPKVLAWLLVGVGTYACYGLAFLYSRWRLGQVSRTKH